jgi:hypothetical protein
LIRVPQIVASTLGVALVAMILILPRLVALLLIQLIVLVLVVVVVVVATLGLLRLSFILLFLAIGWLGSGFTSTFTTAAAAVFLTALTFIAAIRLADTDSLLLVAFLK